jgi:hypothetical protein
MARMTRPPYWNIWWTVTLISGAFTILVAILEALGVLRDLGLVLGAVGVILTLISGLTASTRSSVTEFRGEALPRLDVMTGRLDGMADGLDRMGGGLDGMAGGLDAMTGRLGAMAEGLEAMAGGLDAVAGHVGALVGSFDTMAGRVGAMAGGFEAMTGRLDATAGRVDAMTGGMTSGFDGAASRLDQIIRLLDERLPRPAA